MNGKGGCIVCSHAKTRPLVPHHVTVIFFLSWLQSLLPSQNRERNEQRLKKSSSSQHSPINPRQSTSERGALSSGFDELFSFLALSFLFFFSSYPTASSLLLVLLRESRPYPPPRTDSARAPFDPRFATTGNRRFPVSSSIIEIVSNVEIAVSPSCAVREPVRT